MAASMAPRERRSFKGMPPWLTDVPLDERAGSDDLLLGSPLFGEEPRLGAHAGSSREEREESMLERLASTFTSLLVAEPDSNNRIGSHNEVVAKDDPTRCAYEKPSRPAVLSPPPQVRDPPRATWRVLPSAPEGCPVAGQPIPPQHSCAWCHTCEHPGPRVYLHLENSARSDADSSELREDNLRLRKELREARTVAERAAQHVKQLKRQLEGEECARRQMESVIRRLKHREASLERRLRLHEGY